MVMFGDIANVSGIKVGHYTDKQAMTGCMVILGMPVAKHVNR
jgi:L-aminopeptidase/D-esterase-like protein